MSRIAMVAEDNATSEQKELFDAIHAQLGIVPNFLKVLGNSPTALRAFLGLFGVAQGGSLEPMTRERIALALAQQNSCEYCLSVHSALGQQAGLSEAEISANRAGSSHDGKAAAAVRFARALVEHMGDVTSAEIAAVREAGYTDADIVEIISHVGMNVLTNILGKASRVDIDFPKVALAG